MENNAKEVRVSVDLSFIIDIVYARAHMAAISGDMPQGSIVGTLERDTLLSVCRTVLAGAAYVMAPALTATNVSEHDATVPPGTYSGPMVVTFDFLVPSGVSVIEVYGLLEQLAVAGVVAGVTGGDTGRSAMQAHTMALEHLRTLAATLRLGLPGSLRPAM